MNYWLFKSEPNAYSIDDLKREKLTAWDGIRNYQARNFLRDDCKIGDSVLFYHSNTKIPAVVGVGEVASKPYPDPTQFDNEDPHFDPKATKENPRWVLVDISYKKMLRKPISLRYLKSQKHFNDMIVTQKGSRLSIQPISKKHFDMIIKTGDGK
jgi:predicted RNA-binding protein with PUA-like domain